MKKHLPSYASETIAELKAEKAAPQKERIASLSKPQKAVSIKDWERMILTCFPQTLRAAKLCLAVIAQLLIKDIKNPFALVLVDVPSASKTTTLDYFTGLEEICFSTDKFTPASFVSHASNVKKAELRNIDLLPKLQYKTFVIKDFATVFSEKIDDLTENLGVLTRILDGEGYQRETGNHGSRGYTGEYLFMLLGASTPLRKKVWEVMGNLGARIFFLHTDLPDYSEEELIFQLKTSTIGEKKRYCKEVTNAFLQTLWNQYPTGVEWDRENDEDTHLRSLAKISTLMARLRGVIKFEEGDEPYIQIEKAPRINQLLYNFIRAHALIHGRNCIAQEDIAEALFISTQSAPPRRAKFLEYLLSHKGHATSNEMERHLGLKETATFQLANNLTSLNIIEKSREGKAQNEPSEFILKSEFMPLVTLHTSTQG